VDYDLNERRIYDRTAILFCCQDTYSTYDTPGDKMEYIYIYIYIYICVCVCVWGGINLAASIFKPHMWRMFIPESEHIVEVLELLLFSN
jgi:hypothetical protein